MWATVAAAFIKGMSGTNVNISSAFNDATSGLGFFNPDNTQRVKGALIDLTNPTHLAIGVGAAILCGYLVKRGFK